MLRLLVFLIVQATLLGTACAESSVSDVAQVKASKTEHNFSLIYSPKGPLYTSMRSTWTVPPLPASTQAQGNQIWIGLETDDSKIIVQPVLSYEPNYSPKWHIACYIAAWLKDGAASMDHTAFLTVDPGVELTGYVRLVSAQPKKYIYKCGFEGRPETEAVYTVDRPLDSAWLDFETKAVRNCDGLVNGPVLFRNVEVRTAKGFARQRWYNKREAITDSRKCGFKLRVVRDSTRDGQIEIGIPFKTPPSLPVALTKPAAPSVPNGVPKLDPDPNAAVGKASSAARGTAASAQPLAYRARRSTSDR